MNDAIKMLAVMVKEVEVYSQLYGGGLGTAQSVCV